MIMIDILFVITYVNNLIVDVVVVLVAVWFVLFVNADVFYNNIQ